MAENKTLDIIKGAILLEYRGKALYESVAEKTELKPVKELFEMMVEEEKKHVEILNKQFVQISRGKALDLKDLGDAKPTTVNSVLSDSIVKSVAGAGYEAAVIAAALEFEKNAVKYYGEKEKTATSDEEKKLFNWLTNWETEHMTMLAKIDSEIREQVWYDNNFWPLD